MLYSINNNDTLLFDSNPFFDEDINDERILKIGDTLFEEFNSKKRKRLLSSDMDMHYLFDLDTIKKYSWKEIAEGYKVLKRVDFDTYEDMEKCNFTITYP